MFSKLGALLDASAPCSDLCRAFCHTLTGRVPTLPATLWHTKDTKKF